MEENARQTRHYDLIVKAQSTNQDDAAAATEALLCENMGLVRNAALRFRDRGTEYEDLIQIGTIGMLRAIRTFDISRGTAFSTFAVPLIVGEIRRHLRDDGMIRVSRGYKKLAVELTRIMFPTVLFTGIAFSFVGVLQSLDEFGIPALISTVSNLFIIGYYFTLNDRFGIYGLAVAFLLAWLVQALVQLPALGKRGFRYRPGFDWRGEGMRQVFTLMLPVMVSTWVQPINLTVNSRFGSYLYNGAGVAAIENATNLYLIIAGVFVLSVTNVIFPKLSRQSARGEGDAFRDTLSQTTHATLFFVLPMSAGLMTLARPLVSFVFGGGEFDAFSVDITAQGLVWVSLGMAGYAVQNILSRAYFARQDGRTPLVAGAVSIGVNVALCAVLVGRLQVAGLAVASAVSSTVYALLLLLPLQADGQRIFKRAFWAGVLKMLAATALMALVCVLLSGGLSGVLPAGKLGELVLLAVTAGVGVGVYFLAALALGLDEAKLAAGFAKRLLKRG